MHTKVNFVDVSLFTKSHVNTVAISTLEILKTHLKRMEQHFQDETQNLIQKNNLDYFAAHFAKKLHKNEPTIMS